MLCALAALTVVATAAAAQLSLRAHTLDVYRFPFVRPIDVAADVDVVPVAIQRTSEGDHVTVFVGLPSGYSAARVDVGSVRICLGIDPCADGGYKPQSIQHDTTLKLVFSREVVNDLVAPVPAGDDAVLTVSGVVMSPPAFFAGRDTVMVIGPSS